MTPDPYRLIEETAHRLRRRQIGAAFLPALPPFAALIVGSAFARLPVELVAAALISASLLVLYVLSLPKAEPAASRLIDRSLGAKDLFLTLATMGPRSEPHPLLPLVESSAAEIASRAAPIPLPARELGRVRRSLAFSALLACLLWVIPIGAPPASGGPLERLASALAAGSADERHLALELRELAKTLRDPSVPAETKRKKIEEALAKIEKQERRADGSSGGKSAGSGSEPSEKSQGGTAEGKGGRQAGQGGSGNESAGQSLSGAAKSELQKIESELGSAAESSKSDGRQDAKKQEGGGGIQGPQGGTKEREGQQEGENQQSASSQGRKPDDKRLGSEQGDAQQGEARRDQGNEPNDQQSGKAPNQARGADGRDQTSSAERPSPGDSNQAAERYYRDGQGPDGWRIENGRYVRVRIPDQARGVETENVATPGDVEITTPYGNAPLPAAGSPGEVAESQPAPLEYRELLGAR